MYKIERTQKEIDELLNKCADAESEGKSEYPGMTYEQGISYAIKWLTDKNEPCPFD